MDAVLATYDNYATAGFGLCEFQIRSETLLANETVESGSKKVILRRHDGKSEYLIKPMMQESVLYIRFSLAYVLANSVLSETVNDLQKAFEGRFLNNNVFDDVQFRQDVKRILDTI